MLTQCFHGIVAQFGPPHADTIPYVAVVFCLILGFMIVCRSANRHSEMKLQELDEL